MADLIIGYLRKQGPTRSSGLSGFLQTQGLSPESARQRLSRARPPVRKFPLRLLPKNEAFFYLQDQRNTEVFWENFLRDMRATGSIYGVALDGMIARGGAVFADQFAVVSGAPATPMKRQLHAGRVAETLVKASFIQEFVDGNGRPYFQFKGSDSGFDPRATAEMVLLDAVREWVRKLGFASYNSIAIRGDEQLRPIGPFRFDLAGPSWFAPVQGPNGRPGFLVADVFAQGILDEHQIQFFLRKVSMLKAMRNEIKIMPILIAEGFTGRALKTGHAAGVSLATPTTLFGRRAGAALVSLVQTLKNAAAYASADTSDRIVNLVNNLTEIEGRAGNLRGVLFELIVGYLARRDAVSIEMAVTARDPVSRAPADIDVLKVTAMKALVTCIECKGKEPGGVVTQSEVAEWLRKTAIMRAWLSEGSLREAEKRFEIWTSGRFDAEALALLQEEKLRRVKAPIDWKNGAAVMALAAAGKEKAIADALQQHFLQHPLSEVARAVAVGNFDITASALDRARASPDPGGGASRFVR